MRTPAYQHQPRKQHMSATKMARIAKPGQVAAAQAALPAEYAAKKFASELTVNDAAQAEHQAKRVDASNEAANALNIPNPAYPTQIDLQDLTDRLLPTPLLRYQVRSSLAWTMDSMSINAARSVFFELYREFAMKVNVSFDEFNDCLSGSHVVTTGNTKNDNMSRLTASADEVSRNALMSLQAAQLVTLDFGGGDTAAYNLSALRMLATTWHDLAETTARAAGRTYKPKSLEQLIATEKPQAVTAVMEANFRTMCDVMLDESSDEEKASATEMLIRQKADSFKRFFEDNVKTASSTLFILRNTRVAASVEFHHLDVSLQIRLLRGVITGINNALKNAAGTNMDTMEFIMMIKEGKAAIKAVNEILLNAPQYTNEG